MSKLSFCYLSSSCRLRMPRIGLASSPSESLSLSLCFFFFLSLSFFFLSLYFFHLFYHWGFTIGTPKFGSAPWSLIGSVFLSMMPAFLSIQYWRQKEPGCCFQSSMYLGSWSSIRNFGRGVLLVSSAESSLLSLCLLLLFFSFFFLSFDFF